MKSKVDYRKNVINFINLIETQHNCKIRVVRLDNGP